MGTSSYDPLNAGNQPGSGPLRPGGVSSTGPQKDADLPSTRSPVSAKQQPGVKRSRDLLAGPERIRNAGSFYLPQGPGEYPEDYAGRLARSVFFNFYADTVEGLTGFVFRRDPQLGDDVPPAIAEHMENVDLAGTHFDVFTRGLLADALGVGHAALLVDYPNTNGAQDHADELGFRRGAPVRPYWVPIKKDNILSWRTTVEDGRTILAQVVLEECSWVPDGEFGEKEQKRYRVLRRLSTAVGPVVGFQLLEISENRNIVEVASGVYPTQEEIPIVEIPTSGRRDLFDSEPPLDGLGYLNIAHYQQHSDYATSIHKTCVPILFTKGFIPRDEKGNQITVGAGAGLNSPPPDGDAKYVSHDGASLGECKHALDDLKLDMATLGLAMLATQKRVAETAQSKQIDKAASDSKLAVTARGLQDALERALGFHARYMNLPSGGSVQINREFEAITMDAPMMTAWAQLQSAMNLPIRVVLEALQDGGVLPDDLDVKAIEGEVTALEQAAVDKKRLDLAAQLSAAAAARAPKQLPAGTPAGEPVKAAA